MDILICYVKFNPIRLDAFSYHRQIHCVQVLDSILSGEAVPSKLSRISLSVNSELLTKYPLNDVLIAHPCPASVSRFSFK